MSNVEPPPSAATAVVFAYHNVGCRCLAVLLAHGVRVPPRSDARRFVLRSDLVRQRGIAGVELRHSRSDTGAHPNDPAFIRSVAGVSPDFLFSFYYRCMLPPTLLSVPRRGALNMHGSLLPKYRGRAPVNWAVLHGERETGATLHYMTDKPDAGDIVDQEQLPISPTTPVGRYWTRSPSRRS